MCCDVPGVWMDVWRNGTSFCTAVRWLSEPEECCQDCLMSTGQLLHGLWLRSVAHSLTCGPTPPRVHPMPGYITTCEEFYQVLVLQVTNARVKRAGYESSAMVHTYLSGQCILSWNLASVLFMHMPTMSPPLKYYSHWPLTCCVPFASLSLSSRAWTDRNFTKCETSESVHA